jgi:hypothetical protein
VGKIVRGVTNTLGLTAKGNEGSQHMQAASQMQERAVYPP